jgi:lipoate-protein ligase A
MTATPRTDIRPAPSNVLTSCRLIVDPPASGSWNMAVDEALLDAAVQGDVATLRLYQWSEPTLSIGYFQRYDDRHQHSASSACAIVRRQSGGGAILHDRELTYSLALPPSHPLTRDATALYIAVHEAVIESLKPRLSLSKAPKWRLRLHDEESRLDPSQEPFLCFQRRARGDLLLAGDGESTETNSGAPAYKILGSAQRRHRGAILQHGSLLFSQSPAAPELPGWADLTGEPLPFQAVIADLACRLSRLLGSEASPSEIPTASREMAREIEKTKYSSRSWTRRR